MATSRNITAKSDKKIQHQNQILFNESLYRQYDIFLSHSYLDKIQVLTLIDLFQEKGFSVYVDWLEDSQLDRSCVNTQTAELLRNRMKQSKCLSYLTTKNSTNSKWCPWELGYFDGLKKSKCCILPVLDYGNKFNGQEYLGLYPYLEYASYAGIDNNLDFYICDQTRTKFMKLREWLNGSTEFCKGILV